MSGFDIYEKDGALFRAHHGNEAVFQVQRPDGQWERYEGDRMAPVVYGNFVRHEPGAIARAERLAAE